MRWFALILLVILILLQAKLWLGDGSVRDVRELEQTVETQAGENRSLEERNQALIAEVEDLKEGQDAIEERARTDLGMVREDETFYQVIEEDPRLVDQDTVDDDTLDENALGETTLGENAVEEENGGQDGD
jgi:cell division protein FtsB